MFEGISRGTYFWPQVNRRPKRVRNVVNVHKEVKLQESSL